MDDLFQNFLPAQRQWLDRLGKAGRLLPLLNVTELPDAFAVSAEMPGVKAGDIEIKIEGDTLTLKGERNPEDVGPGASYHRRERATGGFQRSLTLPAKIDPEQVSAKYKNGILTVELAKLKAPGARQIEVKTE
jgi:HSP20 family protein